VLCRAAVEQHQLLAARQQGHQSRILHEKKSRDRRLGHDTFLKQFQRFLQCEVFKGFMKCS
jgi:hypothetical protein